MLKERQADDEAGVGFMSLYLTFTLITNHYLYSSRPVLADRQLHRVPRSVATIAPAQRRYPLRAKLSRSLLEIHLEPAQASMAAPSPSPADLYRLVAV
jgi:hypothetical protein